jgi:ABC-type antimicrobial peptide transport system permease subunit
VRRLNGRLRSSLVIGLQGIRARKTRTLLSMISLFLGVLAVVVVQAGASIAERAFLADPELTSGVDGTKMAYLDAYSKPELTGIALETVKGRADAVAMVGTGAIIGEQGVMPINPGGSPIGENWGGTSIVPEGSPPGQAVEMQVTALTGDVRVFRPYRLLSGHWLDFGTKPSLAISLAVNEAAAKGISQSQVPAQLRFAGVRDTVTPRLVGVVDDGIDQPHAYVRYDELAVWQSAGAGPGAEGGGGGGDLQVLMTGSSPVAQVLTKRVRAVGAEVSLETVNSRDDNKRQLEIVRLVFLGLAGLVLLIGVAGILNVGLASVGERIEEFALRRAVGTPRLLLAGIVLTETLLTGLFTAAAAIGVGILALKVAVSVFGSSEPLLQGVTFPWDAGVAGIIAGLIAGILGGGIPALRAAGIPIATVMRA